MIEYVVEHNPDDRTLQKASQILKSGGLICLPTETNWVAAADPYSKEGLDKLYRLRHIENTKHFTLQADSFNKAMEVANIEDAAFSLVKKVIPGPYTFIFEAQKKVTKYLKASKYDKEVGIHFPPSPLFRALLKVHNDLIITSSITHEMLGLEEGDYIYSALIEDQYPHLIDLIIDPGEVQFIGPSTIIDFTSGAAEVVRVGAGDPRLFEGR